MRGTAPGAASEAIPSGRYIAVPAISVQAMTGSGPWTLTSGRPSAVNNAQAITATSSSRSPKSGPRERSRPRQAST